MTHNVIIVAGGKGLRMGKDLPKQFLVIGNKPILMYTIEAFYKFDEKIHIVLVLPPDFIAYWREICEQYNFNIKHVIAEGGETRFHSVKNGLEKVNEGLVGIHDGARPFASTEMIKNIFELSTIHTAVIPTIDVTDSLRRINANNTNEILDRSTIKQVQTPQVFTCEVIKQAYDVDYSDTFTDDASVVERSGVSIFLAKGEVTNIKITTPFDLKIAELILM